MINHYPPLRHSANFSSVRWLFVHTKMICTRRNSVVRPFSQATEAWFDLFSSHAACASRLSARSALALFLSSLSCGQCNRESDRGVPQEPFTVSGRAQWNRYRPAICLLLASSVGQVPTCHPCDRHRPATCSSATSTSLSLAFGRAVSSAVQQAMLSEVSTNLPLSICGRAQWDLPLPLRGELEATPQIWRALACWCVVAIYP